jgi:hypothetical protein
MTSRERTQIRRRMSDALLLRNQDRRVEALALLRPHAKTLRQFAPAAGLVATLYFETHDYRNSARWFGRAVALAPRSERASLGLFHSLWEIGEYDQAFNEMRRFLGSSDSKEYSRLIRDLRAELSTSTNTGRARGGVSPATLSLEDRVTVNLAERAGLAWRKTRHLTPFAELLHA